MNPTQEDLAGASLTGSSAGGSLHVERPAAAYVSAPLIGIDPRVGELSVDGRRFRIPEHALAARSFRLLVPIGSEVQWHASLGKPAKTLSQSSPPQVRTESGTFDCELIEEGPLPA